MDKRNDNLKNFLSLLTLKSILIQERNRGYYRNFMNVEAIIPVEDDVDMVIYENQMVDFVSTYSRKRVLKKK